VPITFRLRIDDLRKVKGLLVDIVPSQQELQVELAKITKRETKVCSTRK
jgi:hypothetical protein